MNSKINVIKGKVVLFFVFLSYPLYALVKMSSVI